MEIASFGFDTVKARYVLDEPLPATNDGFRLDMSQMGWEPTIRPQFDGVDGQILHTSYFFQVNGTTLRYNVLNAGREVTAELSVPRYRDDSILNLKLASADEVRAAVARAAEELVERLPITKMRPPKVERFSRVDVAVDIYAGDSRQTLIKAAEHFKIPNAKKQLTVRHDNNTTTIKSPSVHFRVYNKAAETLEKVKKSELSIEEREQLDTTIRLGRVRMEYVHRKRGGYSVGALDGMIASCADILEKGFSGGIFQIEDLEGVRAKLDSLDINEMTRAKLYMYFVRRLFLGVRGARDLMSRTSYFDAKKKIREYGLFDGDINSDDLSEFEGEVDLQPVFEALRANAA